MPESRLQSSDSYHRLQRLLAELFQLDQAELDFGIYRIMNTKREEIVRFLDNDLLPQVREAFQAYEAQNRGAVEAELAEAIEKAKELGADPETLPRVKELRAKLAQAVDVTALENEVYSHLYNFFRRYYSEGDFISLRRYKEGVYAIPYEGEEVKLYWANHDQYYIKTAEYFRDYAFRLPDGQRVHFKLVEADTEKDNVKAASGKDRRFIYKELTTEGADGKFTTEGAEERGENIQFVFRFEYRTDEEKRKQDVLNDEAARRMLADLEKLASSSHSPPLRSSAFSAVKHLSDNWKRADGTAAEKTVLEKHLTDYTARNTFDYFIHKDLGGFLRRELDFYIKNEVMHLDDIENETAPRAEQYLSKIKAIRRIAHKVIDFLAQIENFQKRLWLKKKFVVETQYCVTLDRVPEELYPEIAANDAQREEWVRLFAIDEITAEDAENRRGKKGRNQEDLFPASSAPSVVKYSIPLSVEFLKANPYLVLDTRHFSEDFKRRLLASFDDLDEQCDGLLIHSENFQALNLLMERYRGKVECVHIDPPYNTQTSGFAYKNDYQHSSWLAMMGNRIRLSQSFLSKRGHFLTHIDENEYERLKLLFDATGIPDAGTVVWDKRNPMTARRGVATQHEYVIWRSATGDSIYQKNTNIVEMLRIAQALIGKHGGVNDDARREYAEWVRQNPKLSGGEKAYCYIDEKGRVYRAVSLRAPEPRTDPKFFQPLIHPVTNKPCAVPPNGFSRTPETLKAMVERGEILFGADETTQPQQKRLLTEESQMQVRSVIQDAKKGKDYLDVMVLDFPYCHPVSLYEALVAAATPDGGIVLDFFAGSGTTAHAVINLNREDGGKRKYILVEMGEYFDTVLVPRIKKVVYSRDWKDGKPVSREGSSHMFKVLRLESYEDTLNNLELRRTEAQQLVLDEQPMFREDYMLRYMLDVESRGSASLLNLDRFEEPFSYKLDIATGTAGETKPTVVDLVETFNYLIGLRVKTMDHIGGVRVVTGTNPQGERVLILWRNIKEMDNDALDAWFRKQGYNTKDQEFDVIYVNGDNNLENLKKPDQTWKVRLIEEEFLRRMFDVQDV